MADKIRYRNNVESLQYRVTVAWSLVVWSCMVVLGHGSMVVWSFMAALSHESMELHGSLELHGSIGKYGSM